MGVERGPNIVSRTQVFPAILMGLDAAASAVYAFEGDVRRAVYWFAAAVLTWTVTF